MHPKSHSNECEGIMASSRAVLAWGRGRFPVDTVITITAICRQAELVFDYDAIYDNLVQTATKVRTVCCQPTMHAPN